MSLQPSPEHAPADTWHACRLCDDAMLHDGQQQYCCDELRCANYQDSPGSALCCTEIDVLSRAVLRCSSKRCNALCSACFAVLPTPETCCQPASHLRFLRIPTSRLHRQVHNTNVVSRIQKHLHPSLYTRQGRCTSGQPHHLANSNPEAPHITRSFTQNDLCTVQHSTGLLAHATLLTIDDPLAIPPPKDKLPSGLVLSNGMHHMVSQRQHVAEKAIL